MKLLKAAWRVKLGLRGQNLFSISELRFKCGLCDIVCQAGLMTAKSSVAFILIFLLWHPLEDKTKLLQW